MWRLFIFTVTLYYFTVIIHYCSGFSQGSAIVNAFESSYCESGLDDMQRGPLHYDMVSCGGVCRADIAPRNMYVLRANHTEYSANNITLILRANTRAGANILGYVIVAISESGMTAGSWVVDENDEDPEVLRATCDSLLEGQVIFHARASQTRTSVEVLWNPRSTNYGRIIFRAWVVQSHDTIYTVDSSPLTNPLDGASTMSIGSRFSSIVKNIINNSNITTSMSSTPQQTINDRDIQPLKPRHRTNTTTREEGIDNINISLSTTTLIPPLPPSSSPNTPSRIPQLPSTMKTSNFSLANNHNGPESTRKRRPRKILRSVRNRLPTPKQRLAVPAKDFRSNNTRINSTETDNPDRTSIKRSNQSIPLLSMPSSSSSQSSPPASSSSSPSSSSSVTPPNSLTTHLDDNQPNNDKGIEDDSFTSTFDNPQGRLIPEIDFNSTPLLQQSPSSPYPSLIERFENSFQSRLSSGYNLSLNDPFSNFNAELYNLHDFFPMESLPGLMREISEDELRSSTHLSPDGSDANLQENPILDSQIQTGVRRNNSSRLPTITRVIRPVGNSGPQAQQLVQPPPNSNPMETNQQTNQFLERSDFQRQLQWHQQQQQQQQQQQNQNNFNYNFPWMNPMRNFQNFPSFQNPSSFQQVQPQPNQWLLNDNQPFFNVGPNRQNMAANSNNFVGRFPNAEQLLGRSFPNANNNFQMFPSASNNNQFLQNNINQFNQPLSQNNNNNNVGNLALQNQIRMFLAHRNQGTSSSPGQHSMSPINPSRGVAQRGNRNSVNNDGISFNWFG